ncbi:von Hippel-Lindau disease tumour suppressor, beta/alpha domain and von Hippel-Lindau disease tumor suppressor, beta domain-containing protein [Strongyloides ratti]|uniref:von Hippel-Lindau disease tumour suppressor, beta/alpha domain and von Hippel-Lindau disease tumor suppressor, beta domain-containing protein n=1 Tax=Strongyloides ratti TaxID=34506 RepID=A0A090MVB4_STRRB|nr:von Hippel-Lindau disease tumour suppressor, beta/alpha domain and von Hippel-Lindau disease tumor suppressor, beta domain-containing protein [Strongyloides ratti]CEF62788.1 von Hippel-Lindau disease tumour suppressor, beta/alpha domain and von Hippel-Lindau disease tumor suppressor, beta domain-containing protein [Strongyloides ratti]
MEEIQKYEEFMSCQYKSPDSAEHVKIVFRNTLKKHICIYWITHNGNFMLYGLIPYGKSLTIDSYTGHLWCARNFKNGNLVGLKFSHENDSSFVKAIPCPKELNDHQRNYALCFPIDEVKSLKDILITYFSNLSQKIPLEELPLPESVVRNITAVASFVKDYRAKTHREFTTAIMQRP